MGRPGLPMNRLVRRRRQPAPQPRLRMRSVNDAWDRRPIASWTGMGSAARNASPRNGREVRSQPHSGGERVSAPCRGVRSFEVVVRGLSCRGPPGPKLAARGASRRSLRRESVRLRCHEVQRDRWMCRSMARSLGLPAHQMDRLPRAERTMHHALPSRPKSPQADPAPKRTEPA